ncbi:uncharacterized protein LOC128115984 isoform X2 [Peromyscus californicus insignis]|uniref:uncharacterized protein LOC128115984 isoform X2 n=1 Tax=Peromyscus californicus insignis TaxID=564181 RepID=UPI0022A748CA|nr:uncharacterized protein LOC128115984 isoform X2 [Peromyscus californicus insignis]
MPPLTEPSTVQVTQFPPQKAGVETGCEGTPVPPSVLEPSRWLGAGAASRTSMDCSRAGSFQFIRPQRGTAAASCLHWYSGELALLATEERRWACTLIHPYGGCVPQVPLCQESQAQKLRWQFWGLPAALAKGERCATGHWFFSPQSQKFSLQEIRPEDGMCGQGPVTQHHDLEKGQLTPCSQGSRRAQPGTQLAKP